MIQEIQFQLQELDEFLSTLPVTAFQKPINVLEGNTIGAHIRHILELVGCLTEQYESGIIQYDLRKRDKNLERHTQEALARVHHLQYQVNRPDKRLQVTHTGYQAATQVAESSYFRELLYNIEHCIHHQALIKVALLELNLHHLVGETFGMAPSTLLARQAQGQ